MSMWPFGFGTDRTCDVVTRKEEEEEDLIRYHSTRLITVFGCPFLISGAN
jgi:hypothetical protein